jgi:hypothetical protein
MTEPFLYTSQRYFHLVVLGPSPSWELKDGWNAILGVGRGRLPDEDHRGGRVEHGTITTPLPLGSERLRELSRTEAGQYVYDIFWVESYATGERLFVLGVPYVELGKAIVIQLRDAGLLRTADFGKTSVNAVVDAATHQHHSFARISIAQIEATLSGYPSVTGFSLAGDDALATNLYTEIMKEVSGKASFDRCILKVLGMGGNSLSVHCDNFGNYKMWVQARGRNIHVFNECLEALGTIGALTYSASVPYLRIPIERAES